MESWNYDAIATENFIKRWENSGGSERANYQLFLMELCELLELPKADPASEDTRDNAYVFERRVIINDPDGSSRNGFIDLYKRGCFVLEAKQSGLNMETERWDRAMLRAHNQADQYVRALPASEGRPPFIIVTDVGRSIELYAEFSRSGATYTPFPDARSHRISLHDLTQPEIQQRLRAAWLNPLSLDPSRHAAKVTREIADQLAKLAKSLESDGHSAQHVSEFMMRALFTMFSEDVGLLPENCFANLLERLQNKPENFVPMLERLWETMNSGGFSGMLETHVLKFNGGLFANPQALPLDRDQIGFLRQAAAADWTFVEPAIFGTLLERALDPRERHKLGAHYTPRAYVERLVLPTVIEPLRKEWQDVQAAVVAHQKKNNLKEALAEVRNFHQHLCELRILDPACGSGNFLYVTLEHMKRLEGEVLNLLGDLGETQGLLELQGITVDPHQFLGLEINPRAARIAEMVLWIGYLQWHYRTHGKINPPEPVLRDFKNIENRDALLDYDAQELLCDDEGRPLTRWDGITYKTSPVTGEPVPDESAQIEQYRYLNPRKAEWPQADYIVGNPPYIGARRIRQALGDGYLQALRPTYPEVPEHADFVMYWWDKAADEIGKDRTKQFGFITTNSLRQSFSRKVVESSFARNPGLSISFVVPDHPWVDSSDGAAVRVTLTTVGKHIERGTISKVISETPTGDDEISVQLSHEHGLITPNLTIGVDPGKASELKANRQMACVGYQLTGKGFILDESQKAIFGKSSDINKYIRPLMTGRDITQSPRNLFAIDLYGLTSQEVMEKHPALYQWVLERVKPERDLNKDHSSREFWWLFARTRADFRPALNNVNYVFTTSLTAKHRIFTAVPASTICDSTTVMFALEDFTGLGVLSSRVHVLWALLAGGRLGVGNDPRYNKTRCFETFPFPDASEAQQATIRELAERLDAHRKRQQEQHPDLTLTGMYNVLEKLRAEEPLTAKEKTIHEQGLVSVLRELHDDLDRAVFDAYGWNDLAEQLVGLPGATTPLPDKPEAQSEAEEELLKRLVELNSQRAAEEAQGKIRWLRPEYQDPNYGQNSEQNFTQQDDLGELQTKETVKTKTTKATWPKAMREQINAVRGILQTAPQSSAQIADQFKRNPKDAVQAVLDALQELGIITSDAMNEGEPQYKLGSS